MTDYAKIGDPIGEDKPSVFELIVEDHIPYADPAEYGLDIEGINPTDYYITSGDAVEKAKILERRLWKHAGDLRKKTCEVIAKENSSTPKKAKAYESAVWKAAGKSRKMLHALEKARGKDCFLETEWNDHSLLCIPKNPRR